MTIHADDKMFKMTYEIDKVTQQLDALSSNVVALKILNLLGFKIEVEKLKPSTETTPKPA